MTATRRIPRAAINRVLVGVLASSAIGSVTASGAAAGATLCLSHHGTSVRVTGTARCQRREIGVRVATTGDVDALTTRVSALESRTASLQVLDALTTHRIAALELTSSRLQAENDRLRGLLAGVSRVRDTLVFSHMNVQVESGSGSTDGPVNGLGNLILGYNEFPGTQTGSHNLVLGHGQSFTSFGGIVAGVNNSILAPDASVLNGFANEASGSFASVLAGLANTASGIGSSVGAGNSDTASGNGSFVATGTNNTASGPDSFVGGGRDNAATAAESAILGGINVTLTGARATSP